MKWFAGSVSTAIQVSRKNNALFIVFIESENGKGEKMRELWDKVNPTPVLPASYIIDNLGKPIEVITLLKDLSYDEFFTKIVNSVKIFSASTKSGQNEGSQAIAGSSLDKEPLVSSSTSPSSSAGMSLEERTKRAKLLLEQKSAIEKARKQEEEKKRELERINTGKLLQEAQKKRHEEELIEAAAQRRRDKIEAERERERLKAQIKADREEREFRERRGIPVVDKTPLAETTMPKLEPVASDRCRVQVRFPNGENIVEEFLSSDSLSILKELIEQDGRVSGSFSIAQMFPRKVFSEVEFQKSFVDLCLTPTCTLLIIQSPNKASHIISATPLGGIFSLFSLIVIGPLQSIYSIIAGWLGWRSGEILLLAMIRLRELT
uniref:UBX domain-containing protein 4 n=1 Tax=Angiostrongylus cantonensis TaxID=6313 RepID=A0A0K0DM76_ANGCA